MTESAQLQKTIKKEVFALSADKDALCLTEEELEFEFDFDMMAYSFLALSLTKLDQNLANCRNDIVPDLVDEDEFWRNYFYKIEGVKASVGLPSDLGEKIDWEERARQAEAALFNPGEQADTDVSDAPLHQNRESVTVSKDEYARF